MNADLDGSGEISYCEFIAATVSEELFLREDYVEHAFKMFDKDRNGYIEKEEFLIVLKEHIKENKIDKLIKEID